METFVPTKTIKEHDYLRWMNRNIKLIIKNGISRTDKWLNNHQLNTQKYLKGYKTKYRNPYDNPTKNI